ncbi:hypothetical protein BDW02DRAFT_571471 [Decorospora gaudefroyi]|uniref:Uncharacterized protein n=1 Tax=Decorospora gaudefroyi TaxID=184978 RepID=A0A6A5K5V2_9PLEO|nr:hypothetical protein BDW02DRAFT_571471 [Decorospora gaudefroyi]
MIPLETWPSHDLVSPNWNPPDVSHYADLEIRQFTLAKEGSIARNCHFFIWVTKRDITPKVEQRYIVRTSGGMEEFFKTAQHDAINWTDSYHKYWDFIPFDYHGTGSMDHVIAYTSEVPTYFREFKYTILSWNDLPDQAEKFLLPLQQAATLSNTVFLNYSGQGSIRSTYVKACALDFEKTGHADHVLFVSRRSQQPGLTICKRGPDNTDLVTVLRHTGEAPLGDLDLPEHDYDIAAVELDNYGRKDGLLRYWFDDADNTGKIEVFRHDYDEATESHIFVRIFSMQMPHVPNCFMRTETLTSPVTGAEVVIVLFHTGGPDPKPRKRGCTTLMWDRGEQKLVKTNYISQPYVGVSNPRHTFLMPVDAVGTGIEDHVMLTMDSYGTRSEAYENVPNGYVLKVRRKE